MGLLERMVTPFHCSGQPLAPRMRLSQLGLASRKLATGFLSCVDLFGQRHGTQVELVSLLR